MMKRTYRLVFFLFVTGSSLSCLTVHEPEPLGKAVHRSIPVRVSVTVTASAVAARNQLDTERPLPRLSEDVNRQLTEHPFLHVHPTAESTETGITDDLRLTIDLSGYGRLKRKWITWMLATGAVEAVLQGVVVASAVHSTWAGVAIGVEELGSEWITWHGGAWLYGKTFSPVTLEGRLVRVSDGKTVWRKTVFVARDKEGRRQLTADQRKNRRVLLSLHLKKAERILFDDLSRYLDSELDTVENPSTGPATANPRPGRPCDTGK